MNGSAPDDRIFAVATGAGTSAICVVRLSGVGVGLVVEALCGGRRPAPRRASLRRMVDASGEVLDHGLVLWLPGPDSYTGGDMAELHLHGGRAVVRAVTETLIQTGVRPAEPGEFSKRAFLAGRMDLLEAEAAADLVAAETAGQRRQALRQMDGAQSGLVEAWRGRLLRLLAFQEALIDFADEPLPADTEATVLADMNALREELALEAEASRRGQRLRDGLVFTIVGAPNAGKSSLLNLLAQRDAAIVSPTPGTTRDAIEVHLDLGGVPVTLVDTAGLRESGDPIEMEGVRRARARADEADLVIHVVDASAPLALFEGAGMEVANKCDLAAAPAGMLAVSALTGLGVEALCGELARSARSLTESEGHPTMTRARHGAALAEAAAALEQAAGAPLPELRAEELRVAMRALGRITGAVGVEDLLDVVFGSFCIGK